MKNKDEFSIRKAVTFRMTEENIEGIERFQEEKSKELGFPISKNQAINILLAMALESYNKE